ncbi:MAG: acylphosphatase [Acidimicrobiia bacterium]|jgi:acylphosphatase
MTKAVHVHVSGLVQGVGYRQGCRRTARSLDLVGWVRNLADGRVEIFAQGRDEGIDRLLDWIWSGPAGARVTGVESDIVAEDPTVTDFFIQPGPASR